MKKQQSQNNAYQAFKKYGKIFKKYRHLFKDEKDILNSIKQVRKEKYCNYF